ncbi:hypothetical protein, partial [Pseudomonas reactans]|uniref:hypothetical protein n=1 Tax=Pseudomonas reactans TaxID=117680 RepID=UPI001C4C37DB
IIQAPYTLIHDQTAQNSDISAFGNEDQTAKPQETKPPPDTKPQTSKQPLPDTKLQTSKQPLPDTKNHQNLILP